MTDSEVLVAVIMRQGKAAVRSLMRCVMKVLLVGQSSAVAVAWIWKEKNAVVYKERNTRETEGFLILAHLI